MKGKNFSIEVNIPSATKDKQPEVCNNSGGIGFSRKAFFFNVWEFGKEDVNRVLFSLKVGLSVLLVSLLILFQAPYEAFGTNIIWSILTVAIMFEYTVGATFNRGFNRALGSLLAGILAIAAAQLALCAGQFAEPYIIGMFIFLIGTVTSFMKLWPSLVPYEYGFRVILFTFCLIIVSGYRMGSPIRTAMDRLYSIAIGAFVAVVVNVLIFPIWAGEQLHKELVNSFNAVADSLEECVKKYLKDEGLEPPEFSKTVMDEFWDEPSHKKCRSTLNSSAKLESLANSAKWEPPHGRFRHFFYPWSEYVKVGAVLRYCAYEVMALHGVLHSEIRAPYNLRITFQSEIQEATNQAAELLRVLGKDVNNMKRSMKTSLLKRVHSSTERLQQAIDMHSYLLTSVNSSDPSENYSKPLPNLPIALSSYTPYEYLSSQLANPENNSLEKSTNTPPASGTPSILARTNSYHETLRKQSRKMHYSWPRREVVVIEEEGSLGSDILPRMNALESTAALSLATFTSLLIEFVARLDHLVEAVDELSNRANFMKDEGF